MMKYLLLLLCVMLVACRPTCDPFTVGIYPLICSPMSAEVPIGGEVQLPLPCGINHWTERCRIRLCDGGQYGLSIRSSMAHPPGAVFLCAADTAAILEEEPISCFVRIKNAPEGHGYFNIAVTTVAPQLPLSLEASVDRAQIQAGEAVQLSAAVTGGTEPYTYLWTADPPGGGIATGDEELANPRAAPTVTTTYTVTVTDSESHEATDHVDVIVASAEPLLACFIYQPTRPTPETGVMFDASCSTGPISEYRWWWEWDPMNPQPGSEPDEVSEVPITEWGYEPGSYYVRLVVVDGQGAESEFVDYLVVEPR